MACRISTQSDGDSDSDWDDDDDFATKKITIRIKPIAQVTPNKISASVDELRATVGTWKSLANINLVKPNSRRHHQSSIQLDTKLPIAFAIQECLNARLSLNNNNLDCLNSSTCSNKISLIGRLKMALPPKLVTMEPSTLERYLNIELVTNIPWDTIRLNEEFVRDYDNNSNELNNLSQQTFVSTSSLASFTNQTNRRLILDMESIQAYVKQQYQKQPNTKYFILPQLLEYSIGSQDDILQIQNNLEHQQLSSSSSVTFNDVTTRLNPLNVMAHWLCDLTITKVRIDVQFLENTIDNLGLSTDDIKNLKISLNVNGGVVSYQSKPEANWDPLNSKLTWSFTNLTELILKSTQNGMTSCLARLDLNDGPSTSNDINIEFSIAGKTLTGTHVILNNESNCRIVKQKYDVRTGAFKCKSPN